MQQQEFFERYEIDIANGRLGGGAFGTVYKAYDHTMDQWKAVKISEVKIIDGKEFSLISEFNSSKAIPLHKNMAHYESVHQFSMANGVFDYAIMQYYPEGNLKQLLATRKLQLNEKFALVNGLIQGITILHNNGVVHRDIKPSNILISIDTRNQYVPKIADFGLSKYIYDEDFSNFTNSFGGGTLEYSSPEQLYGNPLKFNTDLWSFGIIVYEIFTGAKPFDTSDSTGSPEAKRQLIYKNIIQANMPKEIHLCPNPYDEVVRMCLVADPSKRVKKGDDIIQFLKNPTPVVLYDNSNITEDETLILPSLNAPKSGEGFNLKDKIQGWSFNSSKEIKETKEENVLKVAAAARLADLEAQKERDRVAAQAQVEQDRQAKEVARLAEIEAQKEKDRVAAQAQIEQDRQAKEVARLAEIEAQKEKDRIADQAQVEQDRQAKEVARLAEIEAQKERDRIAAQAEIEQDIQAKEVARLADLESQKEKDRVAAQAQIEQDRQAKEVARLAEIEAQKERDRIAAQAQIEQDREAKEVTGQAEIEAQKEKERRAAETKSRQVDHNATIDVQKAEVVNQKNAAERKKRILFIFILALILPVATYYLFYPNSTKYKKYEISSEAGKKYLTFEGSKINMFFDSIIVNENVAKAYNNDSLFVFNTTSQLFEFSTVRQNSQLASENRINLAKTEYDKIVALPREKITIQMLENYVVNYPESIYNVEVKKMLQKLSTELALNASDEVLYLEVEKSQSISIAESYIDKYPKGKYINEVKKLILQLIEKEESEIWQSILSAPTIAGLEAYMQKYPKGLFVSKAIQMKADILRNIEDEKAKKQAAIVSSQQESLTPSNASSKSEVVSSQTNQAPLEEKVLPAIINKLEKNFVKIAGGKHILGCTDKDKGCDPKMGTKTVQVGSFMISKYEVKQEFYKMIMKKNPSYYKDNVNNPVENLSYNDVLEFIQALNKTPNNPYIYRLPTEAEWEMAALAGTNSTYAGGEDISALGVFDELGTFTVGTKKGNNYGIYDMSGNVAEWCSDDYGEYNNSGTSNKFKVVKGGSWSDRETNAKIKKRQKTEASRNFTFIGFRLVRDIK